MFEKSNVRLSPVLSLDSLRDTGGLGKLKQPKLTPKFVLRPQTLDKPDAHIIITKHGLGPVLSCPTTVRYNTPQ